MALSLATAAASTSGTPGWQHARKGVLLGFSERGLVPRRMSYQQQRGTLQGGAHGRYVLPTHPCCWE